jgi:hypothetical protein
MIEIKLMRISTGEEIVAEIVEETDDKVTIKNGLVLIPTQTGGMGFAPWSPVVSKNAPEITMSKQFVVYIAEVDSEVRSKYNEIFGSKIITGPEKQVIW